MTFLECSKCKAGSLFIQQFVQNMALPTLAKATLSLFWRERKWAVRRTFKVLENCTRPAAVLWKTEFSCQDRANAKATGQAGSFLNSTEFLPFLFCGSIEDCR
uniref:Uncharacterized protein n=1 Tax=Sphaerodactylus townsendi TaxID=933632 RepID=A0ACB8EJP8_9SAUR